MNLLFIKRICEKRDIDTTKTSWFKGKSTDGMS